MKQAVIIMLIGWIFSAVMATMPLLGFSSYQETSICLPFRFEHLRDKGQLSLYAPVIQLGSSRSVFMLNHSIVSRILKLSSWTGSVIPCCISGQSLYTMDEITGCLVNLYVWVVSCRCKLIHVSYIYIIIDSKQVADHKLSHYTLWLQTFNDH